LLERLGCRVQIAATGMQAIDRVMSCDFDVVLMDCLMPELNGFDATRAIRRLSDPVKSHVPIIALTASAEESDRESCLAAGMDAHLAKPVRATDLARTLQHWAGTAGSQQKEPPMTDRPIDPEVLAALKELGGDDPSIFHELVDLFLSDTPERMRGLEEAHASGDVGAIEAAAHALKSSCGNLGAMQLYEMFRDIESCGRSGDVESVSSLIPQVRDEFGRVEEALRREVA
jgi:CheY-like chemotaxis protein/HPt (histidine-containing phosphotransfer) domain-containing protein